MLPVFRGMRMDDDDQLRADLIQARYQLQEARVMLDQLIGQHIENTPS